MPPHPSLHSMPSGGVEGPAIKLGGWAHMPNSTALNSPACSTSGQFGRTSNILQFLTMFDIARLTMNAQFAHHSPKLLACRASSYKAGTKMLVDKHRKLGRFGTFLPPFVEEKLSWVPCSDSVCRSLSTMTGHSPVPFWLSCVMSGVETIATPHQSALWGCLWGLSKTACSTSEQF